MENLSPSDKKLLHDFYNQPGLGDAWARAVMEVMKGEIIIRAFKNEDVKGYAEARIVLEKAFKSLKDHFDPHREKRKVAERGI